LRDDRKAPPNPGNTVETGAQIINTGFIPATGGAIGAARNSGGRVNNPYLGRGRQYAPRYPIIIQYNIQVKPQTVTAEFQIELIIRSLLSTMQDVDLTAAILFHTDKSAPNLVHNDMIPTTDSEMSKYVEDPCASSSGVHGKLSARLTFQTTMTFPAIKRDAKVSAWIQQYGLFFDKSELRTTRTTYIGFFDKKLPHGTRIPIFTSLLNKLVHISKPFQIMSHLVNASEKTNNSAIRTYAYGVLIASPADEATILQEMAHFQCPHMKFYGWEKFKDKSTSMADREKDLIEMGDYVTPHMSLVFNGFHENVMMRMGTAKPRGDSVPAAAGDKNMYSALQD
jgi:hypothetical protein